MGLNRSIYAGPMVKKAGGNENFKLAKPQMLKLGRQMLHELRKEIRKVKHPHAKRFASSLYLSVGRNKVTIQSKDPLIRIVDQGVRPHVMRYLEGRLVPITHEDGTVDFRMASKASFRRGAWRHPGSKGLNFAEKAISASKASVLSMLTQMVKDGIKKQKLQRFKRGR